MEGRFFATTDGKVDVEDGNVDGNVDVEDVEHDVDLLC